MGRLKDGIIMRERMVISWALWDLVSYGLCGENKIRLLTAAFWR